MLNLPEDHPAPDSPVDIVQLDRLVDGELSGDQRRALLEQLETAPGGWRRCALAFLEAQSWGQGLKAALTEPQPTTQPGNLVEPVRRRFGGRFVEQALMLAASFLVAFSLGIAARGWLSPGGPAGEAMIAGTARDGFDAASTTVASKAPSNAAQRQTMTAASQRPRQVVLRFAGQSADQQGAALPVLGVDDLARQWLDAGEEQLPAEWLKQLGREGHRVERVRDLVPVRLSDGTAAEVPVERLQIRYVGNDYQ